MLGDPSLVLLDEPHGNESTYGYATGGWTAAPAVGDIVSRIAPILGVERAETDHGERAALIRAATSAARFGRCRGDACAT